MIRAYNGKVEEKGRIYLPRSVQKRLGWQEGTVFVNVGYEHDLPSLLVSDTREKLEESILMRGSYFRSKIPEIQDIRLGSWSRLQIPKYVLELMGLDGIKNDKVKISLVWNGLEIMEFKAWNKRKKVKRFWNFGKVKSEWYFTLGPISVLSDDAESFKKWVQRSSEEKLKSDTGRFVLVESLERCVLIRSGKYIKDMFRCGWNQLDGIELVTLDGIIRVPRICQVKFKPNVAELTYSRADAMPESHAELVAKKTKFNIKDYESYRGLFTELKRVAAKEKIYCKFDEKVSGLYELSGKEVLQKG